MALNLSKLIGFHRFKWSSDSLGNVLVHNLSLSANSVLNKRFESYLEADSSEFIRILITAVCQLDGYSGPIRSLILEHSDHLIWL